MLEDRDYMRQSEYGPRVSFTVALLIVNAIVFVAEMVAVHAGVGGFIGKYLSLSIPGLRSSFFSVAVLLKPLWEVVGFFWSILPAVSSVASYNCFLPS
jgi:hypothetical protein